jgi:RNAse (barnase) inhibitor barstar
VNGKNGSRSDEDMTTYSVDLRSLRTRDDLHERLAQVFSFPDYYGRNWDAFDECIADVDLPVSVVVSGFEDLLLVLPREAKMLVDCLRSAAQTNGQGEFTITGLPESGHRRAPE